MTPIRILLVDDHPVVRAGIRGMLAGQPDFAILGEAENGRQAVQLAVALQPDVILMDLRMPVQDGVEALVELRASGVRSGVLVLTTYDTDADILPAVEAGATGYLLKDAPREELYRAVRATARGEAVLAPSVAARLMRRVREDGTEGLSARELEVLMLVADGATNQAIGRALHISVATVKSHLIHIFSKLGVSDRTAAVTVALERDMIRLDGR
jgi:DNA-binding NarL/FixJ family response regulator